MKTLKIITTATIYILFFARNTQAQGGLTPPGAPSPTMKTLEQVEPRTDLATVLGDATHHHVISQPGSYYMSDNLYVTNTNGIRVNAQDVTLDLNEFKIMKVSGSGGYGIRIFSQGRVTVRNGSVKGFSYGIQAGNTSEWSFFEKLSVSGCSSYGIEAGVSARIIDCCAQYNPGAGIYAGGLSILEDCLAFSNQGGYGIYTGFGSILDGCIAYNNHNSGIYALIGSSLNGCVAHNNNNYGIHAGPGSSLEGCTAYNNNNAGVFTGSGSSLEGCTAYANHSHGISAGSGSSLVGCSANANQGSYGIYTASGSSLINCSAANNHSAYSPSYGIFVSSGSTVVECSAFSNSNTNSPGTSFQGGGISAGDAATIKDCTVSGNEGDGIRINSNCQILGNTCDSNGNIGDGAGIHVTGEDNRIDGNNVTGNDRGIEVDISGNIIVRNSASGNTNNYDIASGNTDAQVVSPGEGFTRSDSWANFEF